MYLKIDKRDYFTFSIVNLPFICRNILAALSQLIRYSRACGSYQDCLDRGLLLMRKLPNQRFLIGFLTRPTRRVPLVNQELLTLLFVFTYVYWCPKRVPYHMLFVSFNSYTTGATYGAGTVVPFRIIWSYPLFYWGPCHSIFRYMWSGLSTIFFLFFYYCIVLSFCSFTIVLSVLFVLLLLYCLSFFSFTIILSVLLFFYRSRAIKTKYKFYLINQSNH